ncbi:putative ferredoxin [Candidatus Promineifilum breve]|uniref:Ferredoxin n=1 Tax=Candidatus Promineifilum breve TaxID=1806508 RepID=A0A160SYV2_9CHLR|nr:non-heme iron oxygenase ferredoxin subunit [Candidatus Promineifilum breve]CUS02162.2 putative ferredoxin [Candidatus Promineifilum breve]
MSKLIPVVAVADLPPGARLHFDLAEESVILLNIDGDLYCIADLCTHDGGPLTDGNVCDHQIECPRHGARFDVRSGRVTRPPAADPIPTYPVRIEDGIILIEEPDYW